MLWSCRAGPCRFPPIQAQPARTRLQEAGEAGEVSCCTQRVRRCLRTASQESSAMHAQVFFAPIDLSSKFLRMPTSHRQWSIASHLRATVRKRLQSAERHSEVPAHSAKTSCFPAASGQGELRKRTGTGSIAPARLRRSIGAPADGLMRLKLMRTGQCFRASGLNRTAGADQPDSQQLEPGDPR
jgi:hypothetical protein